MGCRGKMADMHLYEALQLQAPPPKRTKADQSISNNKQRRSTSFSSSSSSSSPSLEKVSVLKGHQSTWQKLWLSLKRRKQELLRRKQRCSIPPAVLLLITHDNNNNDNNCLSDATFKSPPQPFSTLARHSVSLCQSLHLQKANKAPTSKQRMPVTDLPYSLFLDIITYLSPKDAVTCRRISSAFYHSLTLDCINVSLILHHFPTSREGRQLQENVQHSHISPLDPDGSWAHIFNALARRYHHLGLAIPYRTHKIIPLKNLTKLRGVTPWNRFLRLNDRTAPFHYWDPVWSFDEKDDLLVYPTVALSYKIRDLSTQKEITVPFDMEGKIMRRTRLCHGILVFEWCEQEGQRALEERDSNHRHFATAFDVCKLKKGIPQATGRRGVPATAHDLYTLDISFRAEWAIRPVRIPLSHNDRFFSTHNQTHYAVYTWQPTRSPWVERRPLEKLTVWEFGKPSPYRPSQHPTGPRNDPPGLGPRAILSLTNQELGIWCVQQGATPSLRGLTLDSITWDHRSNTFCGHVFIIEEEHRWAAGPHSSDVRPRLHTVKSTGIPLAGFGPRHLDECGAGGSEQPNMDFCRRRISKEMVESDPNRDVAAFLRYEEWPGKAPCWRHDEFPYLTVAEVYDVQAGVRISARQCFMLETLSIHVRPRLGIQRVDMSSGSPSPASSNDTTTDSSIMLDNAGDEEMMEAARSIHEQLAETTTTQGPDGEEVHFPDYMWGELLGQGYICGNEKWLIGEDRESNITLIEF